MESTQICKKLKTMDNTDAELTLSLLRCGDVDSLGAAVSQGLASSIPEIYGGALFYLDNGTGELFTTDNAGAHVCTPTPDCIRQAYDGRQRVSCSVGAVPQCLLSHVVCREDRTVTQDCTVMCIPVLADQGTEVYATLVVVGKDLNDTTASKLNWIQKQIAACYSHIQRTFQSQRGSEERASQQLIKLCGELYDQDAAQLQLKVIRYLEEQTQAECGFLLLVVPESQELFCQVVGKKVLQEELRFPGQPSSFAAALESRQPVSLDDIPVENKKSIEEFLECPLHSFLCVPIMSRSDNSLIALACLANKRNANRFTDRDIACIRQCFRYTATVITSTIAFQNERKLKVQTQAMLQVARHLFTNLGEFIISHSWEVENFPHIRSRNCEINVMGSTLFDVLHRDVIRDIRHSKIVPSESNLVTAASFSSLPHLLLVQPFDRMLDKENQKDAFGPIEVDVDNHEIEINATALNPKSGNGGHTDKRIKDMQTIGHDILFQNKDSFTCNRNVDDLEAQLLEFERSLMNRESFVNGLSEQESNALGKSLVGNAGTFKADVETPKHTLAQSDCGDDTLIYTDNDKSGRLLEPKDTTARAFDAFNQPCTSSPVSDVSTPCLGALTPARLVSPSPSELSLSVYASCRSGSESSIDSNANLVDALQCTEQGLEDYFDTVDYLDIDIDFPSHDGRIPEMTQITNADIALTKLAYENLIMDKPGLGLMRVCHSDPAFVREPPTPADSKPELNKAFIYGDPDRPGQETASGLDSTKVNSGVLKHGIQNQAIGLDPDATTITSDNPTILIEDSDCGSSHSIDSNVTVCKSDSGEIAFTNRDITKEDKVEFEGWQKDELGEILVTVSDANIADIQAPVTNINTIKEKDLTKLLREVMQQARNLTNAERCSVFLIDDETDELIAKVFDGITAKKDNEVQEEIRMPATQGIAGHVATSGELLNIKDAYSHPLFYRGIDDSTGFRTRNILCFPIKDDKGKLFPIKDDKGKILGVAQLCNKRNGPCFTQFDEDVATAFGIYCCISISHSLMYKKVIDSQIRNSLANELMMYHMKCLLYKKLQDSQHRKSLANELMNYHMQICPEDYKSLSQVDIPHPRMLDANFVDFSYAPRSLPEPQSPLAVLSMFEDLNFISRWRIRRDSLARFVLMVKKGYRNPPYHNWMHAYTVAQYCYQLIQNLKLMNGVMEDIEMYALMVACLCHDIDHRGTNNSFQSTSKSVLGALYSSEGSVLERHHFAQTMCILNTEGCNIFENLNSKDYQQVLDLLRDIILATDLAHHLKILKNLNQMAERGFDKTSVKDRKLLLCLLMTSCDLSDQTRPWDNTKRVAAMIYKEFFSQGDLEKNLGRRPIEMMDRERAQIPELQIGFLDHVAAPVYKVLSQMFPPVQQCVDNLEDNKRHWEKISNLIKMKRGGSCTQMTFDEVLAIEEEADDELSDEVIAVSNGTV